MSKERGQNLFQQDSAASHTAKITIAWLDRNHVDQISHSASSPDVNLIEPLWQILKELDMSISQQHWMN